jgi:oxygen-independent coproporphyrinogen-3 oxidase
VALDVPHLTRYGLTLEKGAPLFARVKRGEVSAPDDDAEASEYEMAEDILASAGYRHYEISNWAKPGYESRHNTAYWERTPYLGLGVAAHSFLDGKRIANTSGLDEYLPCLSAGNLPPQSIEAIDDKAALSEALFLGLRLDKGVSAGDIRRQFGIDLYSRFGNEVAELLELGLLEREGDTIRLTPRGRLMGNEVFIRFLS